MVSSALSQFAELVDRARRVAHAHLCSGDPETGLVWEDKTEITVRLSLRGDEIWLVAGSGLLVRFVASSEHEFDLEGILSAIAVLLSGEAIEYFGVRAHETEQTYATGFAIGEPPEYAGGLTQDQSRFAAVLGGPLRRAAIPITG
mgnify:CR=1 FL=1